MPVKSETVRYVSKRKCTVVKLKKSFPDIADTEEVIKNSVVNQRTTSDNIRGWRKRIKEHRSATTSLVGVRHAFDRRPYEATHRDANYFYTVSGKNGFGVGPPLNVNTSIENLATTRAMQDFTRVARDKIHSWQGGVFAGELREAARLLASPTKRLRKEVGGLLKLAFTRGRSSRGSRDLASMRNVVADTWLEWSFGVKPIIQDANDAAEAFRRLAIGEHNPALSILGHGYAEAYTETPNVVTPFMSGRPFNGLVDIRQKDYAHTIIRAAYIGQNPSAEMPLPAIFGLDLSSIAPTAWELMPWSFFVDYFTDVGSAIDAWSIRIVNFAWVNRTVRNSRTLWAVNPRLTPDSGATKTFYCAWPYLAKGSRYTVDRQSDFPPWQPYKPQFKIPGYPSTKWLNIAALASGILALRSRK